MEVAALFVFDHVGKSFDGGRVKAVDDVSLHVESGEFLAIVGGSGSGKTTLLRLANRLIEAGHGHITIEGEGVRAADLVESGEFLAIVGGSGSGKTTLLRLANRLIEADHGHITIEGEDVRAADPVALRRRIGYVFQSSGLFPHMSVAANIGITPKLKGEREADIAAKVDELLDLVRLSRA